MVACWRSLSCCRFWSLVFMYGPALYSAVRMVIFVV